MKNLAGSFSHTLTISYICNRQQNLPDSELLLEEVPKRIAGQRLYPANSLNRAWRHTRIQNTHGKLALTKVNFRSKSV